jgi:hypothetical protein
MYIGPRPLNLARVIHIAFAVLATTTTALAIPSAAVISGEVTAAALGYPMLSLPVIPVGSFDPHCSLYELLAI